MAFCLSISDVQEIEIYLDTPILYPNSNETLAAELNILQNNDRGNKSTILLIHHQLYSSLRVISTVIILIIWYYQVDLHNNQDKRALGTSHIILDFICLVTEYRPSLILNHYFFLLPDTDRYVQCGSLCWKNQFQRIRENLTPSVNQKTFKGKYL